MTDEAGDVTAAGTSHPERLIEIDGVMWIARLAGAGAAGSGSLGLGRLEAIEFHPAATPDSPGREVLNQKGRFPHLYDAELIALFARSRTITTRRSMEESQ